MRKIIPLCLSWYLIGSVILSQESLKYWSQWRGPVSTGVAVNGNSPVSWSETKNLKWKTAIPGLGYATPIVWDNKIFILTAVETGHKEEHKQLPGTKKKYQGAPTAVTTSIHEYKILTIDRKDGSILWERTAITKLPHQSTHPTGSWASNSPVTDGKHIYAYFGSAGLYCYTMSGDLKWQIDFGDMNTVDGFGEGSSPVIHGDKIVIVWDHEGDSFITVLDKNTGNELWRKYRDEPTSWSSPLVFETSKNAQIISNGTNRIRSYNIETGDLIWEYPVSTGNVIPTPVAEDGIAYIANGYQGNYILAVRPEGTRGNLTNSKAVLWLHHGDDSPYTPSPLLMKGLLYVFKSNNGILSCFDAQTGKPFYRYQRLRGINEVFASPVGVHEQVYLVGRNGTTIVIKWGSTFEIIAKNRLDDYFSASPVIVENEIYLRGHRHLYCISNTNAE